MTESFRNNINSEEPSKELFFKVIGRIKKEKRMITVRRRLVLFSGAFAISSGFIIPVFNATKNGLATSGFLEFSSLIFSDTRLIIANWQSFMFSLLESVPVMSLITLLILVLIFFKSLKEITEDVKFISSQKKLNTI